MLGDKIRVGLPKKASKYNKIRSRVYRVGMNYFDYEGCGVEQSPVTSRLVEGGYIELVSLGKVPKSFTISPDTYTERLIKHLAR